MNKHQKETIESAKKVGGKTFNNTDYESDELVDQGTAITHEQATDDYTEGTIDGRIDTVDKNGARKNQKGEPLSRKGFEE